MKALVYTAPLELQVLDVDEPVPADDEVVVHVAAAGICGSELEGFVSKSPFRVPPLVMGHEFSARTDDGRLVAVNPLVACGTCDLCQRGLPNVCRNRVIIGIQRPGGFAEHVAVPAANVVPLPDGMDEIQGAYVEPVANGVHATGLLYRLDPQASRVGVLGIGPLGYAVLTVLRASGITDLAAADGYEPRQEWARQLGVSDVSARLSGEFDAIVDTVGSVGTRASSIDLIRPGGTAVWLGLHGAETEFDGQALIRTEKRITACFGYTQDEFLAAVDIAADLETGWCDVVPLSDGVRAFTSLTAGPVPALKTILRT